MIAKATNAPSVITSESPEELKERLAIERRRKRITKRLCKELGKQESELSDDLIDKGVEASFREDEEAVRQFRLEVCVIFSGDQIRTVIVAPSIESINALLDSIEHQ